MKPSRAAAALLGAALLVTVAACGGHGGGQSGTTVAKPFAARPQPTINANITLDQAKALVAKATSPSTDWTGPTSGPKAPSGHKTIAYVSSDQSYVSYVNWGNGVQDAAAKLGWKVVTYDGKGTVSGNLAAMQQAVASNPDAIVTSADASALRGGIKQAVNAYIPVIGIHATAFPGPDPSLNLFDNIATNPASIGEAQAAYLIASSNGTARQVHMLDNSYAIARFKAQAATDPIKHLSTAKFLAQINIPVAEQTSRIPTAVSGMLSQYRGDGPIWVTTCCDNFYPYVASALRSSGATPDQVKLVGSDGPPSAYDMIRKGDYEVATVPEPSTLFGYMAVDSIVHAMNGVAPADYSPPAFLVTKDDVDKEGGDKNQYIPSNGFACHYANTWLGKNDDCGGAK